MKYTLSQQQMASALGDEVVVLNYVSGTYYSLSEVGKSVWESLGGAPKTLEELCDCIMAEYEVSRAACEEDVRTLLDELIHEKLVQPV